MNAACSPRGGDPDFGEISAFGDLLRLLPEADYVVLVAPLTEQTRGMLGAAELAAMPASARLINVGRGGLVDEAALEAALRAGTLAGPHSTCSSGSRCRRPHRCGICPASSSPRTCRPTPSARGSAAAPQPGCRSASRSSERHADAQVPAAAKAYQDATHWKIRLTG